MKKLVYILLCIGGFNISTAQTNSNTPTSTGTAPTQTNIVVPPNNFNSSGNYNPSLFNYVREWKATRSVTDPIDLDFNGGVFHNSSMTTKYFNGFGQPIQQISRNIGSSGDVVKVFDNRASTSSIEYLPYASLTLSKFRSSAYSDQHNYYSINKFPNEQSSMYSQQEIVSNANGGRTINTYEPGVELVGQKHGISQTTDLNTSNEVINWSFNFSTYLPTFGGYYNNGELKKKVTTYADGGEQIEYSDKEGKVICTKSLIAASQYAITYYIHDRFGRQVFTIPPKALEKIVLNSNVVSATIKENLCSYVKFDDKGRAYEKHIFGEQGNEYIVYDAKDRPVMVQTPTLAAQGKYLVTLFDSYNRVTLTGIYSNASSPANWQAIIANQSGSNNTPGYLEYYLVFGNGEGTYPQTIQNVDILTYNYYDNYDYDLYDAAANTKKNYFNSYPFFPISTSYSVTPEQSKKVNGKITAKRVKVLKHMGSNLADWIIEVYFYDRYGNLLQTHVKNAVGDWDLVTTQHNYLGLPILEVFDHSNHFCTAKNKTLVATKRSYSNRNFKVVKVEHKIDMNDWITISTSSYNDLGQLDVKMLGSGVQRQRFDYNIRGQLKGINASHVDGMGTGDMDFGEKLFYESGFTNKFYNGDVSGMIWRGSGAALPRAYGYNYDFSGRIKHAEFNENSSGTWSKVNADYTVSNITYDVNGNLKTMRQMGVVKIGGTTTNAMIDNLTYNYENSDVSNRLQYVSDPTTNYFVNDFADINTATDDYLYDENGNLKTDKNKGITSITYNHLDLPTVVTFSGTPQKIIKYTYDAYGSKIREEYSNGGIVTSYDFIGPMVYKNTSAGYDIHCVNHEEGRLRYDFDGTTTNKIWYYDYFVKDHLGNIRNVLNARASTSSEYFASYELASAHLENLQFTAINSTRSTTPISIDPNDLEASRLNGLEPDRRIGTALLLQVSPGDYIDLSTFGYYDGYTSGLDQPVSGQDMLNAISSTLITGPGGYSQGETGGNVALINNLFNASNYLNSFELIKQSQLDPSKPKAYINYIFFDENMDIVAEKSGIVQVGNPGNWELISLNDLDIDRHGYLAIYLSNESLHNVFFNNTAIKHYKGKQLEEHHYYPFGLSVSHSTLPNTVDHLSLYQGKQWRDDFGLMFYDFHARQYDPQLGRFVSIDPGGQFNSPYIGMANSPVLGIDPDGRWVHIAIGAVVGGLVNTMIHFDDITRDGGFNVGKAAAAFGIGAVAGAVTAATGGAALAGAAPTTVAQAAATAAFAGVAGYTMGAPIQSIGNNIVFGDPYPTAKEQLMGLGISAGMGLVAGGLDAAGRGLPMFTPREVSNPLIFTYLSPKGAVVAHDDFLRDVAPNTFPDFPVVGQKLPQFKDAVSRVISFSTKQIQKKYARHARELGINENYNPANGKKFMDMIQRHVQDPNVKVINGTFRNQSNKVVFYLNTETNVNVITSRQGEFISIYKLEGAQVEKVLNGGWLW